jgi:hypothetical protein
MVAELYPVDSAEISRLVMELVLAPPVPFSVFSRT